MQLTLAEVTRTYSGPPRVEAVKGVSHTFSPGDFVAISGPSGSGKSTLLNILGLLDRPSSGSYRVDGSETTRLRERQRDRFRGSTFGFIFQASHLIAPRTVLTNVMLAAQIQGASRTEADARARECLDRVGLGHRIDARAADLSGGEQQRAGIARALVTRPPVILADEPTGSLDRANTQHLTAILRDIAAEDRIVIVVTHDPAVARRAHQSIRFDDGVIEC